MMVKATPTSTFVMAQAEFTFELFVITFDAPAQFGIIDECGEGRVLGQAAETSLGFFNAFTHVTAAIIAYQIDPLPPRPIRVILP